MSSLAAEFQLLKREDQLDTGELCLQIIAQIYRGVGLSEPFYLVLDNDVLNALQKPASYLKRALALKIIFSYLSLNEYDFRIAVGPAIFFEFSKKSVLNSEDDFASAIDELYCVTSKTGCLLYTTGLTDFSEAMRNREKIERDVGLLASTIRKIRSRKWEVELNLGGSLIKLPMAAARELAPKVQLEYLPTHYANLILQNLVESKILHEKSNCKHATKMFRDEIAIRKSKLIELKGGSITGKGDLALLADCDIASQHFHRCSETCIGVTFDKRLDQALRSHAGRTEGVCFVGGRESEESMHEKFAEMLRGRDRLAEQSAKMDRFLYGFLEFFSEIAQ